MPASRRQFFEKYAEDNQFDPEEPSNWYLQQNLLSVEVSIHLIISSKLTNQKELPRVLYYHNNNLPQALVELFPNIGLVKSRLRSLIPSTIYFIYSLVILINIIQPNGAWPTVEGTFLRFMPNKTTSIPYYQLTGIPRPKKKYSTHRFGFTIK